MKPVLISAAVLLVSTVLANAETFSFAGSGQIANQISVLSSGRLVTTTFTTVGSQVTASGRTSSVSATCISRLAPGGKETSEYGECLWTDGEGSYATSVECTTLDVEKSVSQCSGRLIGASGKYQGKTGAISWQRTLGADRKSDATAGSGRWD